MSWLILGIYVLGWLVTARIIAIGVIESEASKELAARDRWRKRFGQPHADDNLPLIDNEERIMSLTIGSLIALFWPAVLPVVGIAKTLRSPSERIAEERRELEALRKLAHEHNLPMPGDNI